MDILTFAIKLLTFCKEEVNYISLLQFKFHSKNRMSIFGVALYRKFSIVQLHYLSTETQPNATALLFGRVERKEYLIYTIAWYTLAIIGNGYLRRIVA